jgi:hypothetical protein
MFVEISIYITVAVQLSESRNPRFTQKPSFGFVDPSIRKLIGYHSLISPVRNFLSTATLGSVNSSSANNNFDSILTTTATTERSITKFHNFDLSSFLAH